jgi:hypothetical protein
MIYRRRYRFLFAAKSSFFCHINTDSTGISIAFSSIGTCSITIGIGVNGLLYKKKDFLLYYSNQQTVKDAMMLLFVNLLMDYHNDHYLLEEWVNQ